jgi:hypothetical protein
MAGLAITGYQYALATSADSYATYGSYITSSWTSGTSFIITGLTNGTLYKIKVRAVNSLGPGAESVETGIFKPFTVPTVTTTTGSDATTTPTATTTNAPSALQTFSTAATETFSSAVSTTTWNNPYPSGATTGTGTLNGSSGTTHFVWGTSSGSYPNEVGATSNAYVRTTWPRGTTVYYKARIYNTACAATFNGTVNSNGDSATVTIEYGTSSGVYPSSVSAGSVTALTATAVTATVSSLAAGTYYYRVKAVNAAGTTYGTQQSIAISAKSATAASEQSFTPPAITTISNILVVGGGGGVSSQYSVPGGGGGGVTYKGSASVGSTLTYYVGSGGGYNTNGNPSNLTCAGATMTANGGAKGTDGFGGGGGASGSASGGDYNYPSNAGGGDQYGYSENDHAGGGGGGAGGVGGNGFLGDPLVGNPYVGGPQIDVGGNGRGAVAPYGISVSGGGGGASTWGYYAPYGPENTNYNGNTNGSDGGGSYGKGARAYYNGSYPNVSAGNEANGQTGLVRFTYTTL